MKRLFLAFLAGAAAVLSFAPVGIYPFGIVCFAILAALWLEARPAECARLGFAFGLGLFGAGVSWVYVSLSVYGGMPAPLAALATLGLCALLALFPAAAGWLQARVPAPSAVRATLVIPAAWTLFEWLRGWVFGGFPWLSFGYGSAGWPMQGLAPILGVFGVSFLTASLAGLLLIAVQERRARWPAIAAAAVLVIGTQALRAVPWTAPDGEPISVALLQGNIEQDLKFRPERYAQTLSIYARLAEESRARLTIMPETAIPRLLDLIDPDYLARLEQAARRSGGDLLVGVAFRDAQGRYYNSVVSLGSSPRQLYRKSHLVPFGEFVPPAFGWVMRWLKIPMSDFSAAPAGQPPLSVAGQRVAVNICYEDAFGDEIGLSAREATLLVNVSNVAWFGDSLAPAQHLEIARLRAIETGRSYLTSTNTGITAAIARDGTVLARLPQFAEGRLEISAQPYTGETPYMRFGDAPVVFLCLLVLASAASRVRLQRGASR